MSRDICFATQGELVKLAYDAFGVLPRKEASHDDIDETQKKAIQKQLVRLAKEEGGLLSNFEQVIQTLSSILTAYLPSIQVMSAIGDPLDDLLEAYSRLVREEGATTVQGEFTWHVFFSTGDTDDCVDDVTLVSAPSDVVVEVNPEFKIRDADS